MLAEYKDFDGDSYVTVPATLIEDLHYYFHRYDDSRTRTSTGHHLNMLADRLGELSSYHPGYNTDSGTMPYEREDI